MWNINVTKTIIIVFGLQELNPMSKNKGQYVYSNVK